MEERFGRYRVTRTLGSGAMGAVYEAIDDVLGREVAIKTLKDASGITARMADERFRLEARAIAQLSHPGVVQVFDIDLAAEPPYIVLERIAGPSLDERILEGALPPPELAALGIQIARALAAAHAAGVVHRDVKPSNILATGAGSWKLADFGVAHVPDSALTMTGQFVGSPAYAAPEALVKGMTGAASDIYGLGATLYQAAAGRWPRLEAKGAILAPVPPLAELAPHLPAHVAAAIDRAISLDHEKRPTAAELAELIAAGAHATPAAPPAPVADIVSAPIPHVASSVTGPTSGSAATSTPKLRWQPFAAVLAIVIVLVTIAKCGAGDKSPDATVIPTNAHGEDGDQLRPGEIRVVPPEGLEANTRAQREWEKVVDQIYKRHYGEARDKLDDWEQHFGSTPETTDLRRQLEAMPDDDREGPPGHGKHGKHR